MLPPQPGQRTRGVPGQRHVDVAMPQERLSDLWVRAGGGQQTAAGVPEAVEVGVLAGGVLVRQPSRCQIHPHHPRQASGRHGE